LPLGYDERPVKIECAEEDRKLGIKKMKKHYRKIISQELEKTDHFGRSIFEKHVIKKGKRMDQNDEDSFFGGML